MKFPEYELIFCLASVVQWWDDLPPNLRQDIEGSGAEPGCIARARRLVDSRPPQRAALKTAERE